MKRRTNFWIYLKYAHVGDCPKGDFIEDSRIDKSFPREATSWQEIENYLRSKNASQEAITAGQQVYDDYQRKNE
jgi:uncharacterized protein YozE (UPF0346 family)